MQNPSQQQQPAFDLLEFDSPPPSRSSHASVRSGYTKLACIPNLLDHDIDVQSLFNSQSRPRSQLYLTSGPASTPDPDPVLEPVINSQQSQAQTSNPRPKQRKSRPRLRSRSHSLRPLDIVLEESYDTKTKGHDALSTRSIENLADEDSSLKVQEGGYLAGWICNVVLDSDNNGDRASVSGSIISSISSRRRLRCRSSRIGRGSESTLESLRRAYVAPLPLLPRSTSSSLPTSASRESIARDDGHSVDDGSVVSVLLGSTIAAEDESSQIPTRYSSISIRSSLLSSSFASSVASLKPVASQDKLITETEPTAAILQPPPYIRPTYHRSYEIPVIFSVGDDVFLLDSHGNSISWISPKKPGKDGSLLALDRHTRLTENWYRKCNIYIIAKIHIFRDPAASRNEEVYELIPDIGDDGHVRIPLVPKGELMAVKYKTGDRVRVSESEGEGGCTGTVGLAWAEGGKRMYQVMPSGRRGFCRPNEESIRQIECRSKRWDVPERSRCREAEFASSKDERDRYLTKLLR